MLIQHFCLSCLNGWRRKLCLLHVSYCVGYQKQMNDSFRLRTSIFLIVREEHVMGLSVPVTSFSWRDLVSAGRDLYTFRVEVKKNKAVSSYETTQTVAKLHSPEDHRWQGGTSHASYSNKQCVHNNILCRCVRGEQWLLNRARCCT